MKTRFKGRICWSRLQSQVLEVNSQLQYPPLKMQQRETKN